ncbi:MAG: peptidoglycan-associated lipoprotein [Rubrivivax sp. SCN 71-131]|jgi:peptidoglycan-associated lipoprotein|nr:MAG: peptidoglycan-associated lipoprotein [Rubrivivax sp. SCN 71-131]
MKPGLSLCGAALAAAALLAGCASGVKLNDQVPVESRTPTPLAEGAGAAGGQGAASTGATSQSQVASVDLTGKNGSAAANGVARIIYFDFDSFVVGDAYRPVVEGNAKRLVAERQLRMVVEGHTDERGSREYNLALGQKRAEAVLRALELLGASASRVEAVSFGEERPAAQGSNEEAWAQNRRAELKDR